MRVKPSKREKKRYIVFEVLSNKLNQDSAILSSIRKSAANAIGIRYPEAGIRFLKNKYSPMVHKGILRVNNKYAKSLIAALNKNKDLRTLGTSGILRKAERKYIKTAS